MMTNNPEEERKSFGQIVVDLVAVENPQPSPNFPAKVVGFSALGVTLLLFVYFVIVPWLRSFN